MFDPNAVKRITVITNYRGLARHIGLESDLEIRDCSPVKNMVQRYEKKISRSYVGDHILLIDLASKPQTLRALGGRALSCIRDKVKSQTAQTYPIAILTRRDDAVVLRDALAEQLLNGTVTEAQHCSCCYGCDLHMTHGKFTSFVNFRGVHHVACTLPEELGTLSEQLQAEQRRARGNALGLSNILSCHFVRHWVQVCLRGYTLDTGTCEGDEPLRGGLLTEPRGGQQAKPGGPSGRQTHRLIQSQVNLLEPCIQPARVQAALRSMPFLRTPKRESE